MRSRLQTKLVSSYKQQLTVIMEQHSFALGGSDPFPLLRQLRISTEVHKTHKTHKTHKIARSLEARTLRAQ